MLKKIVLVRARPGMAREQFFKIWLEEHAPLAHRVPEIKRYIQNHIAVDRAARSDIPAISSQIDGIVETWYDDFASMERANTTEAGRILRDDSVRFVGGAQAFYVDEKIIIESR